MHGTVNLKYVVLFQRNLLPLLRDSQETVFNVRIIRGYQGHRGSWTRRSVISISGNTWWWHLMMTVYRHHSCILGNSQSQSRTQGGTISLCHILHYVTDKGTCFVESITFSRYCNITINDVGRTAFSSAVGNLRHAEQFSMARWVNRNTVIMITYVWFI
jgi:outer membrane protease